MPLKELQLGAKVLLGLGSRVRVKCITLGTKSTESAFVHVDLDELPYLPQILKEANTRPVFWVGEGRRMKEGFMPGTFHKDSKQWVTSTFSGEPTLSICSRHFSDSYSTLGGRLNCFLQMRSRGRPGTKSQTE
jgi:hypothetical protein